MLLNDLIEFYERDLNKLEEEIKSYKNESDLWIVKGEIANSAGNLVLHLVGNLNHFIGATLAHSGYIRQRDLEFSTKNVPLNNLVASVQDVRLMVIKTLAGMNESDLEKTFPLEKHDRKVTSMHMLLHLLLHLDYHLGQINYHRRLCGN